MLDPMLAFAFQFRPPFVSLGTLKRTTNERFQFTILNMTIVHSAVADQFKMMRMQKKVMLFDGQEVKRVQA